MSGGHEFQQDRAGYALPEELYKGSPPNRQVRARGVNSRDEDYGGPWPAVIRAAQRKGDLNPQYGSVGTAPVLIRPQEERLYIIIQNTSLANQLFVGVGYPSNTVNGLLLAANGGAYEPSVCPQQEIWLLGSGANTTFVVLYANG